MKVRENTGTILKLMSYVLCRACKQQKNERKIVIIFYPSVLTYILGAQNNRLIEAFEYPQDSSTQNNRLIETVLLSTPK